MLPLFPKHPPDALVYEDAQFRLSRAAFLGATKALAAQFAPQSFCVNLCDDRLGFMLGFCAAVATGQCTLLPASRTASDLSDLARRHPGATALCDAPRETGGLPALIVNRHAAGCAPFEANIAVAPSVRVAELFTSGSSGTPQPHGKTWGMLVLGAERLAAELDLRGTLLGSVPSQHMFGLESTILLPMQTGLTLAGGCPLLPQDIQVAMARLSGPVWWATTPMHLRACVDSGLSFPRLAGVLCATQTLAPELAQAAEKLFQAPLHEIYGCTEAGVVGMRRPALDPAWRLLPDWRMTARDGNTWIEGPRASAPLCLPDLIERLDGDRFLLHGRHASLVKVGGKRMHLDALNHILLSVPGVRDGVFHQPADGARLAALVVADQPDAGALLAALRLRLDPVFLPRRIHWVQALPRNAVGKLPKQALEALLERLSA